jgi:hypothetical protein
MPTTYHADAPSGHPARPLGELADVELTSRASSPNERFAFCRLAHSKVVAELAARHRLQLCVDDVVVASLSVQKVHEVLERDLQVAPTVC